MAKWIRRILICYGTLILLVGQVVASDYELITADTVNQLQSVFKINYTDFDVDLEVGWFVANDSATEFVVFDRQNTLHQISNDGQILKSWQYAENEDQLVAIIDGVYYENEFYILYALDDQFWINEVEYSLEGIPLALGHDDEFLYVEAQVENTLVVYKLDDEFRIIGQVEIENDTSQPVIRVGRIALPIIVQTTFDGNVQIFNFDQQLGQYQVSEFPTVFGHINYGVSHFAWSDPNSTFLNLLNIDTGVNVDFTELNNLYAQYYLLSHDASLAIAVNVDFVPNVVGWNTSTGERVEVGEYRDCNRIPDKVQLSVDGTTLIIGCDTGLELWKVKKETKD